MNLTLTQKIGLLFFSCLAGVLLVLNVFWSLLGQLHESSHFINIAGRQRMIAEQIGIYAYRVSIGHEEDRVLLYSLMDDFGRSLDALQWGGAILDRPLSPAPSELAGAFARVRALWHDFDPALRQMAGHPENARQSARDAVFVDIARLRDVSHGVLEAFEAYNAKRYRKMAMLQGGIAMLILFVGCIGIWMIRRYNAEHRRQEKELKNSEKQFRELLAFAPDAIVIANETGRIVQVNLHAEKVFGYCRDELIGKSVEVLFPRRFRCQQAAFHGPFPDSHRVAGLEIYGLRKDGSEFRIDTSWSAIQVERKIWIYYAIRDITARVQMEKHQRQLEGLSRRVVEVREEECRRVARELHDEIGQALTAVKLNLQAARRKGGFVADLAESIDLINQILEQVRDLSVELRPSVLDDLGLPAALRWLADRQAQRAGFRVQLDIDAIEPRLPIFLEVACFRIAQEALTNAARHAGAWLVRVALKRCDTDICLSIWDNGTGFDVAAQTHAAGDGKSLGLLSMHERASLLGGKVQIHSEPGMGTEVAVRFSLEADAQAGASVSVALNEIPQ